jgi:hypothetical protein
MGYFKTFRRKIGVATLMIACVFAAGWVRSRSICEQIDYAYHSQGMVFINSGQGLFVCGRTHAKVAYYFGEKMPAWSTMPEQNLESLVKEFGWKLYVGGFGIAASETRPAEIDGHYGIVVPYWSIVIPLTVISTWLLLSAPGTRTIGPA